MSCQLSALSNPVQLRAYFDGFAVGAEGVEAGEEFGDDLQFGLGKFGKKRNRLAIDVVIRCMNRLELFRIDADQDAAAVGGIGGERLM